MDVLLVHPSNFNYNFTLQYIAPQWPKFSLNGLTNAYKSCEYAKKATNYPLRCVNIY